MKSLHYALILLLMLVLPSCMGGAGFQPPLIGSAGGNTFILFPVESDQGTKYFVGSSPSGELAVQWEQADGSTVLLVKPKRGNMVFYINGKRVGAKEANPVVPDDVVIPEKAPQTSTEAQNLV